MVINAPAKQKAFHQLPFTIYQLLCFAVPTRFARLIAHAVLSNGLNSLEENMAGAGAPGGLPLIFRFFLPFRRSNRIE